METLEVLLTVERVSSQTGSTYFPSFLATLQVSPDCHLTLHQVALLIKFLISKIPGSQTHTLLIMPMMGILALICMASCIAVLTQNFQLVLGGD